MAVYQFYLGVVPKEGIIKIHGSAPEKIKVSTETGYFESNTEQYWQVCEIDPKSFISEIDKIVKRAEWSDGKTSYNWKTYTDTIDNDASIYLNDTGLINEFSFRADLRNRELNFLIGMIELGRRYNWLFMDRNGVLANPEFEAVKERIKESNAYRFLQDPIKFLGEL
jgi:hypothetical protein